MLRSAFLSLVATVVAASLRFVATPKTWIDARAHCQLLGLELASIHREEENAAALALVAKVEQRQPHTELPSAGIWIGLMDGSTQRGVWSWSDGSSLDYVNWERFARLAVDARAGCAAMLATLGGAWRAVACNGTSLPFLCRGDVRCSPDAPVPPLTRTK